MRRLLLHVRRSLSTAATSTSTSFQWRRSLELQTLASQVSSLLLHRRRFPSPSIFRSLIPSPLPSSLFLRVLSKLRSHPQIALRFFRFAVSDLAFAPDLRSRAAIVQILVDADLFGSARVILDQAIRSEPSAAPLLDSVLRSTTSAADFMELLLNCLLAAMSLGGPLLVFLSSLNHYILLLSRKSICSLVTQCFF